MVITGRRPGGRPASRQQQPGGPGEEARRQVTVLFCDLVGSTTLAAELDPEELRELLGRYQSAAAGAVENYGGRLHHTLGDGLMASWGFPQAHEDDAARGVHAGLALIEAVRTARVEASPVSPPIEVRVAVHTGLALVADTTLGGRREVANLIGETPNVAARLQDVARPGSVVMSAATAELVHGRFESVPVGDMALRGVPHRVRVHRVVRAADGDRLVVGQAEPPPLTGRAAELRVVRASWDEVVAGGARVLLVQGEAGIGKTLLVRHACSAAARDGATQLGLQCAALQGNIAFYPIRRMLERAAGIGAADTVAARREALRAFCAGHPSLAAADPEAPALLASLLGVADDTAPGLSPDQRRERVFAALRSYVDGLAAAGPLVIAVEDLHWADHSTQEFVRRLAEHPPHRTLVMFTTRTVPEWSLGGATVLPLAPLAAPDTARLVARVCPGLPTRIRDLVAMRADGIPLFAEELARVLARAEPSHSDSAEVPPRLHDLLVARLDERPEARPLLQALATVGASAPRSLIERTAGLRAADVRRMLGVLVDAGVLTEHEPARDPVYRFRHVLLRDAAYATLPRSRRRALHATVAADLLGGDRNVVPAIVAHHLEQGGDPAASAAWWLRAGYAAAQVAAHREVVDTLRHLLGILHVSGQAAAVDELEVLALLSVSLVALEGYTSEEVARLHGRARELVERSALVPGAGTVYPLWAYHHVRGELGVSAALAQRLHVQAPEGNCAERAMSAAMVASDLMEQGRLGAALPYLDEARRSAREPPPGIPHEIGPAVTVIEGVTLWILGERGRGRDEVAAAVRAAESLGLPRGPFTRAFVHTYAAWWALLADDPDAAAAHAARAVAEATEHGFPSWLAAGTMHAAGAQARLGGPAEAAAAAVTLDQLLAAWRAAGAETFRPEFLRWLAEARAACGDTKGALTAVREGLDHVRRFGGHLHEPELHRLEGLLRAARGEQQAAVASLLRAARVAHDLGALSFEARARADLDRVTMQPEGPG